ILELVVERDLERSRRVPLDHRDPRRLELDVRGRDRRSLAGELAGLAREVEPRDSRELAGGRRLQTIDREGRARVQLDAEAARHDELSRREVEGEPRGRDRGGDLSVVSGVSLELRVPDLSLRDRDPVRLELHFAVLDLAVETAAELDVARRAVVARPE